MLLLGLVLWLIAVQACGLAALPLARRLFRALPDEGYGLSKPLGLLLVGYAIWLPAMLGYLSYTRATTLVALAGLATACWWGRIAEQRDWLRRQGRMIALEEGLLLGVGLLALVVRLYNADIIGQEKFMDLAFFNGFLAADRLPAEDAWLAGYGMPYYPFGYFMLGLPAKLAGLAAPAGYNLALVLVLALTSLGSAALVANVVSLVREERTALGPSRAAWLAGLFGALLVGVVGNLVGPLEVLAARGVGSPAFWSAVGVKGLQASAQPVGWLPTGEGWWWQASRVIPTIQPDGITEFPYFSFLLGDLHPHFVALPLLLLVVGLALALLVEGRPWREPPVILAAGLVLGVPIVANTWDAATAWTLYGLAGLAVAWRAHRLEGAPRRAAFGLALAPIPLGGLLFSPYFVGYASQPLGLGLVTDRTPLVSFLIIFGPLLLLSLLLVARLARPLRGFGRASSLLLFPLGLALGLLLSGRPSGALAGLLLTLVVAVGRPLLLEWLGPDGEVWRGALLGLLGLAGVGFVILVATELVFIRDSFGTRMNTVFKFYYHVWLLLGLVGGAAGGLVLLRSRLGRPRRPARPLGGAAVGLVLALGLVYPLGATWTKANAFRGPATLDGAAFLERERPGDAAAIRWLAGRPGRPVVIEAVGNDYEEFGRVSVFSGLPTVIGWIGHELQWRGPLDEYQRRQQDVEAVYKAAERAEGQRILDQYRVRYVFVGSLERQKYGSEVEPRLATWLRPVFRAEGAVVFGVPREGQAS